jgi:uncharacterized protein (TIGR03083 family)
VAVTWDDVITERRATLDTFESLVDEQWAVPSLCEGWTVRDVLAHLVLAADPRMRHWGMPILRAGGSFDKANDRLTRAEATRPVPELLRRYRERHQLSFRPPFLPLAAPMSDAMLHGLDVRIPLGVGTDRPPERWVEPLGLIFSRLGTLGFVPRGLPKLRWIATDHQWSHGDGPEVRGRMADLALTASGRRARVEHLEGPGQPAVARWLGA